MISLNVLNVLSWLKVLDMLKDASMACCALFSVKYAIDIFKDFGIVPITGIIEHRGVFAEISAIGIGGDGKGTHYYACG